MNVGTGDQSLTSAGSVAVKQRPAREPFGPFEGAVRAVRAAALGEQVRPLLVDRPFHNRLPRTGDLPDLVVVLAQFRELVGDRYDMGGLAQLPLRPH